MHPKSIAETANPPLLGRRIARLASCDGTDEIAPAQVGVIMSELEPW
jgi:hypothetical protein